MSTMPVRATELDLKARSVVSFCIEKVRGEKRIKDLPEQKSTELEVKRGTKYRAKHGTKHGLQ